MATVYNNTQNVSKDTLVRHLTSQIKKLDIFSTPDKLVIQEEEHGEMIAKVKIYFVDGFIKVDADETYQHLIKLDEVIKLASQKVYDYTKLITAFAATFMKIEGASVNVDSNSNVTVQINDEPAAKITLYTNELHHPSEFEIAPTETKEGDIIREFVQNNDEFVFKASYSVSGHLVKFVSIIPR